MGRTVSRPSGAVHVTYSHLDLDEDDGYWEFQELVACLRSALLDAFPSAYEVDTWLEREDHAIAANQWAWFGISEYCGLVSVWVARRELDWDEQSRLGLQARWLESIEQRWLEAVHRVLPDRLVKVGTFSNGEAIYQSVSA